MCIPTTKSGGSEPLHEVVDSTTTEFSFFVNKAPFCSIFDTKNQKLQGAMPGGRGA